jgi:sulfur carrier protein ThiS
MMVKIVFRDREFELPGGITILQALKMLDIPSQTVIPVRGDELIPEDEPLMDGEEIELISVISGG